MKTRRKVYYLNYTNKQVPMIRLSGKYLNRYGINIGDSIKVIYTKEQIIITKIRKEY
jgi:hypothetical protein